MKRPALYSRSPSSATTTAAAAQRTTPTASAPGTPAPAAVERAFAGIAVLPKRLSPTGERILLVLAGAVLAALLFVASLPLAPSQRAISQRDIDKAVLHTLATKEIPSAQARAVENVRKSVVMVRGFEPAKDDEPDVEEGVGTGVVIVDSGIILTNMHVALAAKQLKVEFADGLVSDAVSTVL